ncbi:MAG: LacI family DNA-binding transcriptional regulator [candidate division KSB1 bacterium]|nr:LacI family DNA-binding transcriptional regulator [candidate division KSB1 bacterium]
MQKNPSLKQVAEKANVSIATVSRALNYPEKVDPKTLNRINKVIKALNYRPNRVAQRLRIKDGHRKIIGLLVPDIQNPFYVDVVRGVEDYAYSRNYALLMCNFAQNKEKERMYLDIMVSESVDGMILAPFDEYDQDVMDLLGKNYPIVCVDRGLAEYQDVDIVLVDNERGAFEAVSFLIEQGYKRIAYVGGLPSIPTSQQRKDGYVKALQRHNIPVENELVRFGDSKHDSGKVIVRELLQLEERPTAFFTGNNLITLGALETIHAMNLAIPDDVAIIGFDDMPWSISLNPPLTAVKQPGYEIGKRAADLLYQKIIEPEKPSIKMMLNTELMIRDSC